MRTLREQMSHGPTAVLPHTLRGMGGVGKTQLVIEYAHRFKADYDLVWWIASDTPLLIPGYMGAMAEKIGLPSAKSVGIDEACRSVLDALRRGEPHARWLLIFDNANTADDVKAMIPASRPPQGHVLITSRNARWEGVANTLVIDVFDREESIDFLRRRAREITPAEAGELAEELGDLPLALEQAGALQTETGMSSEEYLELLRQQPLEILDANQPMEYPGSMTAAWRLSINALEDELPEAMQLLRCTAFFGPEPIPIDIFRWGGVEAGPIMTPILRDPILRTRAIALIHNLALGKIDDRAMLVHRLVQRLLRADLGEEQQADFRNEAQLLLGAATQLNPDEETNWGIFSRFVPHLEPVGAVESTEPRLREVALKVLRYLYLIGHTESARTFATRFRDTWGAASGGEDRHTLNAERHLADILRQAGRFRAAFDLNKATLERARRTLPDGDELVLEIVNSFGADHRALGLFREAVAHDELSRKQHLDKYGSDDPRTLRTMNNLALDYALVSEYQRAVEMHTAVMDGRSRPGVGSKLEYLSSLGNLGQAARLSGDYAAARALGADALDYGRTEFGGAHTSTLSAGVDLSIAERLLGRLAKALELARDMYDLYESTLTPGHPETLAAGLCLANALRTNDEHDEAYDLTRNVIERLPRIYGSDHPFTLAARGNLALLERTRGHPERARDINRDVLDKLDTRLGRLHDYSLTVALNLSNDLHELEEFEAALELDRQTAPQAEELLGARHPLTLGCYANLAASLRSVGKTDEAARLLEDTLAGYYATLTARHPDTVLARAGGRLDFDFDQPRI
ncbi:tetratricopeptide repeat protein [Actinomadura sp. 7K534]|nr:tetratricopeptide repeat protein [Actinomadura sp. 7K534]